MKISFLIKELFTIKKKGRNAIETTATLITELISFSIEDTCRIYFTELSNLYMLRKIFYNFFIKNFRMKQHPVMVIYFNCLY